MKTKIYFIITVLLIFISCSRRPETQKEQPQNEVPEALQDKSDLASISKRSYGDIVSELYNELLKNDSELNQLETEIDKVITAKNDSAEDYYSFNQKNQNFYQSARQLVSQISDSTLKEKIYLVIEKSQKNYETQTESYEKLIESIDKNNATIADIHKMLMIVYTLPVIEKFQKENSPSINPLINFNNQQNKILEHEKKLIYKNNNIK